MQVQAKNSSMTSSSKSHMAALFQKNVHYLFLITHKSKLVRHVSCSADTNVWYNLLVCQIKHLPDSPCTGRLTPWLEL